MKLFKLVFLTLFVVVISIQAQSKDDIYNDALEEYLDGNYKKALEIIEKSDESDIYISTLKAQIEQKLGKTSTEPAQVEPKEEPQIEPQQSTQTVVSPPVTSINNEDLYIQALNLYQSGNYNEALDKLNKVDSDEIDTEPLRQQILAKLGDTTSTEEKLPRDNDELYFTALELFQNAKYKESLEVLDKIESDEIDTEPLRKQILAELDKESKEEVVAPPVSEEVKVNRVVEPVLESEVEQPEMPDTINLDETTSVTSEDTTEYVDIPPKSDNTNVLLIVVILILFLVFVGMLISLILINKDKKKKRTIGGVPTILIKSSENGKVYNFNKNKILIGRENNNDIVLKGDGISKQHAGIFYNRQKNSFNIKDLDSRNGTILNGKRVKVAPLSNGDKIKILKSLLVIQLKRGA